MNLKKMIKKFNSNQARLRRHQRMRNHLAGTQERPRLNVFRSGNHIYAQVIDDTTGRTLVAASSLDASLRDFKPAQAPVSEKASKEETHEEASVAAEAAPAKKEKAPKSSAAKATTKAPAKGGKNALPARVQLPAAEKRAAKTPVEALAAIANNRKVALAREVGKLVAQRAKEQGVSQVVFDRGGYAYHGRIAALAEGAREVGLKF